MSTEPSDCQHHSRSGDEGPWIDLSPKVVVRWRCDECNTIVYDDAALAAVRGQFAALKAVYENQWAAIGLAIDVLREIVDG